MSDGGAAMLPEGAEGRPRPRRTGVDRPAAVIVALLLLASCGGGADGDDERAASPTSTTSGGVCPDVETGERTVELGERWYLARIPEADDGERRRPLVVDLHGYAVGARAQTAFTGIGLFADQHGFVTVTPEGSGPVAHWNLAPGSADLRFIEDVLDSTEAMLCTDPARVYVTGHSNGAMMASVVACELSDRVAAVAPVAGVWWIEDCDQERPVPLIAFHAVDDDVVGFDGTLNGAGRLVPLGDTEPLPVPEVIRRWDARTDAPVVLHTFEGIGHGWPPTANELMWAFFQEHRLPVDRQSQ